MFFEYSGGDTSPSDSSDSDDDEVSGTRGGGLLDTLRTSISEGAPGLDREGRQSLLLVIHDGREYVS